MKEKINTDVKYCKLKNSNVIYLLKKIENETATLFLKDKILLVNKNDIKILENYKPMKSLLYEAAFNFTPCNKDLSENTNNSELMLRHLTIDESIPLLEKFIDNAIILKLPQVKIIHGKKGGVIRKAVHEYLKNSCYIESYTYAQYYDGSYGATIAKIKR